MERHKTLSIAAALARLVRNGAPAAQMASELSGAWRHVEKSLSPIIGTGGVGALYKRMFVACEPIASVDDRAARENPGALDLEALTKALLVQRSTNDALGGGEHLQTFHDLLVNLIGSTLTRKLLSGLWEPFEE